MEREPEQPPFDAARDDRRKIEERRRLDLPAVEDDDPPGLKRQEQARIPCVRDGRDRPEARRQRLQRDVGGRRLRGLFAQPEAEGRAEQQDAANGEKARPRHSAHRMDKPASRAGGWILRGLRV